VAWSGLARYFAGLYQLNVKMPRYLPSGRHLIQVVAGGQSSQAEVWLAGGEPVWRTVGVAAAGSGGGTISGAGLELSIPPGALESKRRESLIIPKHFTATIWGISGFRRLKSPAGKFVVSVLAGRDEDLEAADITGRILEEALGKLKALGIETDTLRTTPIDVFLFDFSSVAGRINVLDSETAGRRTAKFGGGPTWACR